MGPRTPGENDKPLPAKPRLSNRLGDPYLLRLPRVDALESAYGQVKPTTPTWIPLNHPGFGLFPPGFIQTT